MRHFVVTECHISNVQLGYGWFFAIRFAGSLEISSHDAFTRSKQSTHYKMDKFCRYTASFVEEIQNDDASFSTTETTAKTRRQEGENEEQNVNDVRVCNFSDRVMVY